jgi:hypothetical protein
MRNDQYDPVRSANEILQAGLSAAWDQSPEALKAAERAVEQAVGALGLIDPAHGQIMIDEALLALAKKYVRECVQMRQRAA